MTITQLNGKIAVSRRGSASVQQLTETFLHPALETDELKSITGNWFQRVWEYNLMKDPATHEYLRAHGVTMISYRELIEMKKRG